MQENILSYLSLHKIIRDLNRSGASVLGQMNVETKRNNSLRKVFVNPVMDLVGYAIVLFFSISGF